MTVTASPSACSNQSSPITPRLYMANPRSCYRRSQRAKSVPHRWTKYHQRVQVLLRSCSWITGTSKHILPCQMVRVFTLSGSFMGMKILNQNSLQWSTRIERTSSWLNLWMDFFGLFPGDSLTAFRLTRVLVLSFLPDLGVSAFLLSLFTDPVKFMCPLINLAFQGMVVEVELPAKFSLYCFKRLRLQVIRDRIIFLIIYYKLFFPSFPKAFWLIIRSCDGKGK